MRPVHRFNFAARLYSGVSGVHRPPPCERLCNMFFGVSYRLTVILGILVFASAPDSARAEPLDYSLPDPELKVIRLDTAPTESFLAVKADTTGRLFVGGREALYVYDPVPNGQYRPRQQLLRFPNHTWVYDIEIRGDDLYLLTVSALYLIPEGRTRREGLVTRRII